jgi:hypothetical protein
MLHDLTDYWRQCKELKMDLTNETILFPSDLQARHMELTKRIKYKNDRPLNVKIKSQLKELNKIYCFEFGGLIMRPARDTMELITEGNALVHCVGGYAAQYANGQTVICFIRREDAQDVPFHTAELRNGSLVQCRGFKNKTEEADKPLIDAFLKSFENHTQSKTRRKAV